MQNVPTVMINVPTVITVMNVVIQLLSFEIANPISSH